MLQVKKILALFCILSLIIHVKCLAQTTQNDAFDELAKKYKWPAAEGFQLSLAAATNVVKLGYPIAFTAMLLNTTTNVIHVVWPPGESLVIKDEFGRVLPELHNFYSLAVHL